MKTSCCTAVFLATIILSSVDVFIVAAEHLEIQLDSRILKEPLVEVILPKSSSDKMRFRPNGLHVQQFRESSGPNTGCGLIFLTSVEGDFKFELDFEVNKLEPPRKGWGQGLMIRFLTDDEEVPIMAAGCIANAQYNRAGVIEIKHTQGESTWHLRECSFTKGSWVVERLGSELIVTVRDAGKAPFEIGRKQTSDKSLRQIQLWFTRLNEGNGVNDFILHEMRLTAEQFFTYRRPKALSLNWKWIVATIACGTLAGCAFHNWRSSSSRK